MGPEEREHDETATERAKMLSIDGLGESFLYTERD